ncbi:MAG: STAS/SEC14 domain-containing protein, partial [Rhodomicrobium sp.]
MFKLIEGLPQDVLGIEATGKVTHADYATILIPAAEAMMAKGPVKMFYVAGEGFEGYELEALWDDGA